MLERIRGWLTTALLAVVCVLLYQLAIAVEDVAVSVEDACVAPDSEDAPAAQIARAHERPSPVLAAVKRLLR